MSLAKTTMPLCHNLFAKDYSFCETRARRMTEVSEYTVIFFFFLLIKRIRHSLENCCIEELFLAIALNVPPLFIFTALEISSAGNSTLSSRRHLAGVRSEIWLVDSC